MDLENQQKWLKSNNEFFFKRCFKKKKNFLFLNIFLFLYIVFNLLTGERGLMAYFEKSELEKKLTETKIVLKLK